MGPSEFIAFFSLIVSVIALIYTFVSNTKRFELADQYRKDLLSWYQDTIRILLKIRGQVRGVSIGKKAIYYSYCQPKLKSGDFICQIIRPKRGPMSRKHIGVIGIRR